MLSLVALGSRAVYRLGTEDPKAHKVIRLKDLKSGTAELERRLNLSAGRDTSLLRPYAQVRKDLLGQTIKRQVMLGQAGWMFLGSDRFAADPYQQVIGVPRLDEQERLALQLQYYQRAWWCQQQNIDYWFLITPNKATIYPEYLPSFVQAQPNRFLDQLLPQLSPMVKGQLIDIRKALREAKSSGPLYYHTDTHWNRLGAAWGAWAVLERLTKAGYPAAHLSPSDFSVAVEEVPGGDQTRMLMLRKEQFRDTSYQMQLPNDSLPQQRAIPPEYAEYTPYLTENAAASLPKMLFFHDSFGHLLRAYLALEVSELTAVWRWGRFDPGIAAVEQPEIILDQIIERNLGYEYPGNEASLIQDFWKGQTDLNWQQGPRWERGTVSDLRAYLAWLVQQKQTRYVLRLELAVKVAGELEIADGLHRRFRLPLAVGKQVVYWEHQAGNPWNLTGKAPPSFDLLSVQWVEAASVLPKD